MNNLTVIVGYRCNYLCRHCINDSGPNNLDNDLDDLDIAILEKSIKDHQPKILSFAGGETTLYCDTVNKLIDCHPQKKTAFIEITTNGWFAKDPLLIERELSKYSKLDKVRMSFDIFHGMTSKSEQIDLLYNYCKSKNMEFELTMAISDPVELINAKKYFKSYPFEVTYQKVINSGRASKTGCGYKYNVFDQSVRLKKCPAKGRIVYIPRLGFTSCCSSLVFDKIYSKAADKDLSRFLVSKTYLDLRDLTFEEIAEKNNIDIKSKLNPSLSLECNMCADIYRDLSKQEDSKCL